MSANSKRLYVLHVRSSMEKAVKKALVDKIKNSGYADRFGEILLPTETLEEVKKNGKRELSERHIFPGYVLIEMEANDEAWYLVKNTPNVIGFLGASSHSLPTPINSKDENAIRSQAPADKRKPKPKLVFEIGSEVRVKDGPFADFNGQVEEVNYEKSRVRVCVPIFGRQTPVDLEFNQVEKV